MAVKVTGKNLLFLSTPSARRATRAINKSQSNQHISIHALREEGDVTATHNTEPDGLISIHALREEGDDVTDISHHQKWNFYPRPPRGGRPERGGRCSYL